MSAVLDKLLKLAEGYLPESKGDWIADLRAEAAHLPAGLSRMRFQGSGLLAAVGHLLRFRFGPQKIGQILLASALYILCVGGLIIMQNMPDDYVKAVFYCVLPLYALAGTLAVLSLSWMKRFTISCSFVLAAAWLVLGLGIISITNAPLEFIRAISLEAAFMMIGLFIAASYLSWMEEDGHA